jgi:hypothetical protein
MRLRAKTILLVMCVLTPGLAAGQTPDDKTSSRRVIVMRGTAKVKVVPDRAYVILATEVRARKPDEAQRKNTELMVSVQQMLRKQVPADAIRTLSYSLLEEFDHVDNRRVSRGYRASNTLEVRVDDISQVGRLLDVAVESGTTTVNQVRFDLKDRNAAERQALREAAADAWARAEAAAAGAKVSLGEVVRIDEPGDVRPVEMMTMRAGMQDARGEVPIVAGEIEIDATVTLSVAIR